MHRVANLTLLAASTLRKPVSCSIKLCLSAASVFPSSTSETNEKTLLLISSHLPDLLPLSTASVSDFPGLCICVTSNHAKRGL